MPVAKVTTGPAHVQFTWDELVLFPELERPGGGYGPRAHQFMAGNPF